MPERTLAILVTARDLASRTLRGVNKELGGLGGTARTLGRGLGAAATNIARLGAVAGGFAVIQAKAGLESLAELQSVEAQTAAALKSTAAAAGQSAGAIRTRSEALEQLTTIDDKVIQSAQNLLLTFTNIKGQAFEPATKAVLDLATAMGTDERSAAILVGKALNDPVRGMTALRRVGVAFTKDQEKQIKTLVKSGKLYEAQALILGELNREFGGSAAAQADTYAGKMRRVGDAVEDAQMAFARGMLPVLERFADFIQRKLGDPAVITAIERGGQELATAFEAALDAAEQIDWGSIVAGLSTARDVAGVIFDTFMSAPDWLRTAVITGWGLNKLTGGMIGELGKGLVKGVLGMNAGVVNIRAGAVTGAAGAAGGAAGAAGRAGGGFLGKVAILGSVALAGATILALKGVLDQQSADNAAASAALGQQTTSFVGAPTTSREDLAKSLAGLKAYREELLNGSKAFTAEGIAFALNIDHIGDTVNAQIATLEQALRTRLPSSGDPRLRPTPPTAIGAPASPGPRWGARFGPPSRDPKIAREEAAVAKFAASTAPSMRSMEAHLASLRTLQASASSKDATNTAAIVAAIARLESRIASLPTPIVNVELTAKAVAGATTTWKRTGRGARLAAW